MRDIDVSLVSDAVRELCIKANKVLPANLEQLIRSSVSLENSEPARGVMNALCENLDAAKELDIPICQDCGMAVVFAEVGQEVHFVNGGFENAVNEGVGRGYKDGYLRCSVVGDPLKRVNTGDNTPAVLHTRIVPGDRVKITVAPKGFGSENMSRLKMFTPSVSRDEIIEWIVDSVRAAGGNPCPPIVLGVGIGGDFEQCALLAKKALCRSVSVKNSDEFYAGLEAELLEKINALKIGPQGFGGNVTALSVAVETAPTHIAGLPVAVNFGCHVTRHAEIII
ncbi:MAG: fumarate hydratase [Clostridia bacterium]|nr:fumarate hydratase [Clostridia bacterium]